MTFTKCIKQEQANSKVEQAFFDKLYTIYVNQVNKVVNKGLVHNVFQ